MTNDPAALRVLSIPAQHPYTQAIRPACAEFLPDPDIDGNWWPHPALEAEYWQQPRDVDIVHIHFGFEHRTPAEIAELTRALPVPLVLTVHDLDNPHLEDQGPHHERLQLLIDEASAVIALTDCAAEVLSRDYGAQDVHVVPHPRITGEPVAVERGERAAVFVKSLRGNVVADPQFYLDAAAEVPLDVYVHDVAATEQLRRALEAGPGDLHLHVHEPMSDAELFTAVGRARACILPYTRGTHSGWLEMCRDHGTPVAVPDTGCYAGQADVAEAVRVYAAGDGRAAGRAAAELTALGPVPYAGDRAVQAEKVRQAHEEIYRRAVAR
ncbi:glycosyltransferase [Corynebacterium sp. Marseille-P4321]|uniref:glycosyltransferase n=1 Tax=Corynebacterium sp. Marseille-P4321 TaxID=2736603 RepID=UPI0015891C8D|nr:glycosyltransferase [Corynebacterium sp. Marseille-P4321]